MELLRLGKSQVEQTHLDGREQREHFSEQLYSQDWGIIAQHVIFLLLGTTGQDVPREESSLQTMAASAIFPTLYS